MTKKLKKLALNQITLVTVFIISLVPIIQYSTSLAIYISSSGTIIYHPQINFLDTENNALVNSSINASNFLAELTISQNQTFEVKKLTELVITNWHNNPIDLSFQVSGFKGNFESIADFELSFSNEEKRVNLLNMDNGFIQLNQTEVYLEPETSLFMDIMCEGRNFYDYTQKSSLTLSISHDGYEVAKIDLVFNLIG